MPVGFYLDTQKRGSWKIKSLANIRNRLLWQVTFLEIKRESSQGLFLFFLFILFLICLYWIGRKNT